MKLVLFIMLLELHTVKKIVHCFLCSIKVDSIFITHNKWYCQLLCSAVKYSWRIIVVHSNRVYVTETQGSVTTPPPCTQSPEFWSTTPASLHPHQHSHKRCHRMFSLCRVSNAATDSNLWYSPENLPGYPSSKVFSVIFFICVVFSVVFQDFICLSRIHHRTPSSPPSLWDSPALCYTNKPK